MSVLRLFPEPHQHLPLQGLYLGLNLHRLAGEGDLLVYANYIASLDGRISLRDEASGEFTVPGAIANKRDWRLYQELAAQADVLITSARYFRQLAKGCAQDLLPVGSEPEYADLRKWRQREGLKEQPDIVVLSGSLDIPLPALTRLAGRRVLVLTGEGYDRARAGRLADHGVEVRAAGEQGVEGGHLRHILIAEGYRAAYMIAGPDVHATLLAGDALDHLFLTTHHTLLGGDAFHTLNEGVLPHARRLQLQSMHLDTVGAFAQHFAHYTLRKGN